MPEGTGGIAGPANGGPRTTPQLLDGALRLYLSRFAPMLSLSLVGTVVGWLLLLTGHAMALPTNAAFPQLLRPFSRQETFTPALWAAILGALVQVLIWTALITVAGRAATAPDAAPPSLTASIRAGLPRVWPVLITGLALTLGGGLGLVLLIIPGVFLLTRWSVAPVAAVLEQRGAASALGRSFSLVRGLFWHTLGTYVLGLLAAIVFSLVLGSAGSLLAAVTGPAASAIGTFWSAATTAAVNPFMVCLLVLLYFDLRARNEDQDPEGTL